MSSHAPRQMLPQHRVTAILVTHDGAAWLPAVLDGISGQIRPPDLVIGVDTGSVDTTKRLLAGVIEARDIVTIARTAGFGAAVAAGVAVIGNLGPLPQPEPYRPFVSVEEMLAGDPKDADPPHITYYDQDFAEIDEQYQDPHDEIEAELPEPTDGADWLWLLHDDAVPEADALLRLIEVAETSPTAKVLGPKVCDWDDVRLLLEVGVTIDHSGRRETGLERSEFDQGQHDSVRDVFAVGSAGMLVRRDVWDELGGFDSALPIFRDDIDFCWRANLAGHRVVVAPASRLRHARASFTGRRRIRCAIGRPSMLDRRHSLFVVLANVSTPSLLWNVPRLVIGALLRTAAFLLTRQAHAAGDEIRALGWNLAQVPALITARSRRQPMRRVDSRALHPLFAGRTARLRGYVEAAGDWLSGGAADPSSVPSVLEADAGDEPPEIAVSTRGSRVRTVLRRPVVALSVLISVVSLIAARDLLGPGRLLGGHLLPAPTSARELWDTYTASWHDVGGGSSVDAPAWMSELAGLSSLLFGKAWLAVDVLLLFAVPLSALSAYFAARRVTASRALRLWGAAAYAVLPAATAAIATGRLDVAVLAILLPCVASACYRAVSRDPSGSGWRHAFV
ncbi:MAG: glycosyltransferase, partial [Mycobacteriales bacterium]